MEQNLYIFPYYDLSKTVHSIRKAIDPDKKANCRIIKCKGSKYEHSDDNLIINWGSVSIDLTRHQQRGPVLNPTNSVKNINNRSRFLKRLKDSGVNVPDFTRDLEVARDWVRQGSTVIGRFNKKDHSGKDIIFSDEHPRLEGCDLFLKYIPKVAEYRIHVFRGAVIATEVKNKRDRDDHDMPIKKEQLNWRIRSLCNGFKYEPFGGLLPEGVLDQAKAAFAAAGDLDFAAIEIIYNRKERKAYVIDASTSPYIDSDVVINNYARKFKAL